MATFTIDLLTGTQYLFSGDFNGSGTTSGNTGIGWSSLIKGSTVAGCGTLPSSSSLVQNTIYGVQAGNGITTGSGNVAVGFQTLYANTTGCNNFAGGSMALYNNDGGNSNIAIGFQALYYNSCGYNNIANGFQALYENISGNDNIANGYQALLYNTCGSDNIANGNSALLNNISGSHNIANGIYALQNNIDGSDNIANGNAALASNTSGYNNIANGHAALLFNTIGTDNIANGQYALLCNTIGNNNIANGNNALLNNVSGNDNIANGLQALADNTIGCNNIANGNNALLNNTVGCDNIANGFQSLFWNITGSSNIAFGYQAGYNETGSNKLYIANSSTVRPLIYGDFGANCAIIYGAFKTSGATSLLVAPSNGTCSNSVLVWDSATCLVKKVPYVSGSTLTWSTLSGRPAWLTGTTLSIFQTGHTHSQYALQSAINTFTGTTAPNTYLNKLVTINAQTGLTYILVLTDNSKTITLTNASPITVTIPAFSGVSFQVGTTINLIQGGVGKVTFTGAAGVTIKSKANNKSISAQNVAVSLLKESTNTWYLIGDLIA